MQGAKLATLTKTTPIRLKFSSEDQSILIEAADGDRWVSTVNRAVEACQMVAHREKFKTQFYQELLPKLANWTNRHVDSIDRAYLTVRDSDLLFLVIRDQVEYDREFEDHLTKLDLEIAQNEVDLDLIRLSVLALPACSGESIEGFVSDDYLISFNPEDAKQRKSLSAGTA